MKLPLLVTVFAVSALTAGVLTQSHEADAAYQRIHVAGCNAGSNGTYLCPFAETEVLNYNTVAGAWVDVVAGAGVTYTATACLDYLNGVNIFGGACGNGAVNSGPGFASLFPPTQIWATHPYDYLYLRVSSSGGNGIATAFSNSVNGYGFFSK